MRGKACMCAYVCYVECVADQNKCSDISVPLHLVEAGSLCCCSVGSPVIPYPLLPMPLKLCWDYSFGGTTSNNFTWVPGIKLRSLGLLNKVNLLRHVKRLELMSNGRSVACRCHQSLHLWKRGREGDPFSSPQL